MSRKMQYIIPLEHYVIGGTTPTAPIKLLSVKGLKNEEDFSIAASESMEEGCWQVLQGEKTGWKLINVHVELDRITLYFKNPPNAIGDDNYIVIYPDEGVELKIEAERGNNIPSDLFLIGCSDIKSVKRSYHVSNADEYAPRVVEILNAGLERRTFTFYEETMDKLWYTVTEERY